MSILRNLFKSNKKQVLEKAPVEEIIPESLPLTVKKTRYDIWIFLKDGTKKGYNHKVSIDTKTSCIKIFYRFYRWFYFKESEYYTYTHSTGLDIYIRSEIKLISITKTEIEEAI